MRYIERSKHEKLIDKKPECYNKSNTESEISTDLELILEEQKKIITENDVKFASTWLLERDLWLQAEVNSLVKNIDTLSRGRVVLVNPGVSNIGREQRYIHPYIVLGEHQETFIGVPITNMAYDKKNNRYYLRHFFEVELVHSSKDPKPFTEYRVSKRSIADIRNISGMDKRRIIKDQLYSDEKFAPKTYLNAISEKIISSLASLG